MAGRKNIPFVISSQHDSSAGSKKRKRVPKPRDPLFTIEKAFSPFIEFKVESDAEVPFNSDLPAGHFDVERGIRAVAFLLNSVTQNGNRDLDGNIATGLGRALACYADEIDRLEKARRLRRAGPR